MSWFGLNKKQEIFWKQKLYFLTDRLGMSRKESRLILILAAGTLAGALYLLFRPSRQHQVPAELKASFEERRASLEALKDQILSDRYYPEKENEAPVTVQDRDETSENTQETKMESAGVSETIEENSVSEKIAEQTQEQISDEPVVLQININTADKQTLTKLNGVGPVTAERIIDFREQYGAFKAVEELKKVKGIGPKTLEKLAPHIILND